MSLLSRIQILREENGNISINKLEKEAGLSRGSMSKWDDHAPSPDKLQKVANYFNVSISYLIGETDSKEPPTNQDITFDDFTYALHNETKELSEEKKQQLLEMARFFKQQQDKKKEK